MKTKRKTLLSDGTPIRIGQIVTVINNSLDGNRVGVTTKVVDRPEIDDKEELTCRCTYVKNGKETTGLLWEAIADLRLATPKEKKRWERRKR